MLVEVCKCVGSVKALYTNGIQS